MRVAVIADCHGNHLALDAVAADILIAAPDVIVDLGDVCSGPLWPAETAERLMDMGVLGVRGNHDRVLLEADPAGMGPTDRVAHEALGAAHRAFLAGLPGSRWLDQDVYACHGCPGDDEHYLLETIEPGPDGQGRVRAARPEEVSVRLGDVAAAVVLTGHSHIQRLVRLGDGTLVVNPGSVGLPAYADDAPVPHRMEAGSPHARYAILDGGPAGWTVTFRAVAYRWDHAAARAASLHRPDWAHALATGFMA